MTSWRSSKSLEPGSFALAIAGFTIGLGGLVVALQYMPIFAAVVLATVLASGLVVRVLGAAYLSASGVAAILPLAFVSGEHSGLIVLVAAALTLVALGPNRNAAEE